MKYVFLKKFLVIGTILLLTGVSFTFNGENKGMKNSPTVTGEVENFDTGDRFESIQAAIDHPNTVNGHTLSIHSGTYLENVIIGKSLTIIGESRDNTFIVGDGSDNVVTITADGVNILGCTIQNYEVSGGPLYAGIKIYSNNNVVDGTNPRLL